MTEVWTKTLAQLIIKEILSSENMSVDVANNGLEAIEMVQAGAYDVILMDMQMPILDGYSATKEIRAKGFKTPRLALTAHALKEETRRIFDSGADAHLTKPINVELLLRTIRTYAQAHISSVALNIRENV
ncbi:MAG: response regulator [Chitinophagaceae bacterium]|nr:response regulator [Oligoflexus sp.]